MDNYEQQLATLKEEQKNLARQKLENAKNEALTQVGREEAKLMPEFTKQKQQADTTSQIKAKNFAEFLSNRGQTNAGIAGAAEMSSQNMLGREIGNIQTAANTAQTGFAQNRTDLATGMQNNLSNQYGDIEQTYAQNLLQYREQKRQEELARQEQLRREALARQEQLRQEQVAREQADLAYRRSIAKASSGTGYTAYQETAPTAQQAPTVTQLNSNTILVKQPNGQGATLTITPNTKNDQILAWGKQRGVDLSAYLS